MQAEVQVKDQVRAFYDEVGWAVVGEGVYQNARYEDLRPVSRSYIRRCHRRVLHALPPSGELLLDAGSGPIQYPEYLEYSRSYRYRVCLDISIRALQEARRRIADHGLYVVGDMARLPFKPGVFSGAVSMHAVHHLPAGEQRTAFDELERVLQSGGAAVVVYSWGRSPLMALAGLPIAMANWAIRLYRRVRKLPGYSGRSPADQSAVAQSAADQPTAGQSAADQSAAGATFTYKHDYRWVRQNLTHLPGLRVRVWRSVNTGFLRALIHRRALGRVWLELLYRAEQLAPRLFGIIGQYPLIRFEKG